MNPAATPGSSSSPLAREFVRSSTQFLSGTYTPRLSRALAVLPEEDLWWRPHPGALSCGQILRHLEGNVRQWILSGLSGAPDHRLRASEFEGPDARSATKLLATLSATVSEACEVIAGLDDERLLARHAIQGSSPTGLQAVQHVVEHFAWHTGQAVWIAKSRAGAGHGLAFYDSKAINAARNG